MLYSPFHSQFPAHLRINLWIIDQDTFFLNDSAILVPDSYGGITSVKRSNFGTTPIIVIFVIITVILCPLSSVPIISPDNAAAEGQNQVEFTPEITPLSLTQTAEYLELGTVAAPTAGPTPALGPGQTFEKDDPHRPRLDPENIHGDPRYGYAQLTEDPDLYAVWITNAEGTHYLIVPHDSQVLTGGTDPGGGFFFLVSRQETLQGQIMTATGARNEYYKTGNKLRVGTGVVALAWAACAIFTDGLCLALGGLGGGFFGLSIVKDNDAAIQENLIEVHRTELENIQRNLRGKFTIGQVLYGER